MPFPQLRAAAARMATGPINERTVGKLLVGAGIALALVAGAVQSVAHLTNELVLDGRVYHFNADGEGTAFAWAASVAIFAGGFAALIGTLALTGRARRRALALGAVLVFLSLDEIVQIHERLGTAVGKDLLGLPGWADVRLWLVIYLPLLLATLVLLLRVSQDADEWSRRSVRGGVGLLVAAIGIEALGLLTKWLEERGTDLPDVLRITVEEATELAGWILIATGLTGAMVAALLRAGQNRPA